MKERERERFPKELLICNIDRAKINNEKINFSFVPFLNANCWKGQQYRESEREKEKEFVCASDIDAIGLN